MRGTQGLQGPKQDFTGQRFGSYIVTGFIGGNSEVKMASGWLCNCDCGKEDIYILSSGLRFHSYCVCETALKRKKANFVKAGEIYGHLKVLERVENNSSGQTRWKCKCSACGEFTIATSQGLSKGNTKSCGCVNKNKSLNRRRINDAGYVVMYRPKHANSDSVGNIAEHRFIMSELLGRPLESHENIHHINGIRNDNRIENLELWITSQPAGQRVQDKLEWAKEILRKYENLRT